METLADALPKEQERVRELIPIYESVGVAGAFAVAMMKNHFQTPKQTISNTQAAELLGFTRQHFESFKVKYPGFPDAVGTKRPTVKRADGSTYVGTPFPVFDRAAVLKWIADNDIKRTRGAESSMPRGISFDNEMAQMFIRRPMMGI